MLSVALRGKNGAKTLQDGLCLSLDGCIKIFRMFGESVCLPSLTFSSSNPECHGSLPMSDHYSLENAKSMAFQ